MEEHNMLGIIVGENSYIIEIRLNNKLFDFIAYEKDDYINNCLNNGFQSHIVYFFLKKKYYFLTLFL